MSERRNLVIAILAAFVFGMTGGVVGTLATMTVARHHGHMPGMRGDHGARHREGGVRRGEPGQDRMLAMLDRHLDLSEEQRTRIEGIVESARPRYAAVRESTRAEIERVLTPGQRAKWKELEEQFPARRRERAGRMDRPPGDL